MTSKSERPAQDEARDATGIESPDTRPVVSSEGALGFFGFLTIILRRWRLISTVAPATIVVALTVSVVLPPAFTATVTFVPEAPVGQRPQPAERSDGATV